MGWLTAATQLFKLITKVISLFMQKDAKKSAAQKEELDKLTNAAKETDPKKRTSKLNRILDGV